MSQNGTDIGVDRRREIGRTTTRRATDAAGRFVRDVMHRGILTCDPSTTVAELARMMVGSGVHCIVVRGASRDGREEPRVWGIVSDLDLLAAVSDPHSHTSAETLANQPVVSVRPETPLDQAALAMTASGTSHLVVIESQGLSPVGILSALDVATVLTGSKNDSRGATNVGRE
jgi:CBS domain-containing protein